MRKLITVLFSCLLAVALAGSAGALTIDPNPVNQYRPVGDPGGELDADVELLSIVGNTMTLQLSVTTGSIDDIYLNLLLDSWVPSDFRYIIGAGTNAGTGDVAVVASYISTKATFTFSDANNKVDAGETSDEFWVEFEEIPPDWVGAIGFDAGTLARDETYVTVPEPSTALLMLLAAGVGLVVARRPL